MADRILVEGSSLIINSDLAIKDFHFLYKLITKNKINKVIINAKVDEFIAFFLKYTKVDIEGIIPKNWDRMPRLKSVPIPFSPPKSPYILYVLRRTIFPIMLTKRGEIRFWFSNLYKYIQVYFWNNIWFIFLIFSFFGFTVLSVSYDLLKRYGLEYEVIEVSYFSALYIIVPMVTCVAVMSKSCVGTTGMIRMMEMNNEFETMKMLGLNPDKIYFHSHTVALLISTFLINFISLIGFCAGSCIAWALKQEPIVLLINSLIEMVRFEVFMIECVKIFISSLLMGIIACASAIGKKDQIQSVMHAIEQNVIYSFIAITLTNSFITIITM